MGDTGYGVPPGIELGQPDGLPQAASSNKHRKIRKACPVGPDCVLLCIPSPSQESLLW